MEKTISEIKVGNSSSNSMSPEEKKRIPTMLSVSLYHSYRHVCIQNNVENREHDS